MEEKEFSPEANPLEVRPSAIAGRGIFAKRPIVDAERIGYFEGRQIDHPTYHSVMFGDIHVEPSGDLRFLNNSCDANAEFRGRSLFARRAIAHDEEVTIDYLATEETISNPFSCHCGSSNCRGVLGDPPPNGSAQRPADKHKS
jgi:SET domain-containing protein